MPQQRTLDKITKVLELQDQNYNIANYYFQPITTGDRGKVIAKFTHLLERVLFEAGEKREDEVISAVLGIIELLELVVLPGKGLLKNDNSILK